MTFIWELMNDSKFMFYANINTPTVQILDLKAVMVLF